jgi:CheY-like chemotaxis protein
MTPPLVRILYVEDEPKIQVIARMALERVGGFTVEICDSGQQAVDAAPAFAPDLILLDVRMPGMDGPTTMKALRELPGFEATPIVFMTANVMAEDIERYKEMGAVDVIAKPFQPMTLPDRLREIWATVHG